MSNSQPTVDPKELIPAGIGVVIGIGILIGFGVLASVLGLTLFVDQSDIPYQ